MRRSYEQGSTRRFLVISMWFMTQDGGGPFWFMDNWHASDVDSIFWWQNLVRTNANPGIGDHWFPQGEWHQVGIEVDQDSGMIVGFMFDGYWFTEDDSSGAGTPGGHDNFRFQGYGQRERISIDE